MRDDFLDQHPPLTRRTYAQALGEAERIIGTAPESFTQDDVVRYRRAISHQAPATVAKKLAALGSLYRYLIRRGLRPDDPTVAVQRPKVDPVRSIRWLTDDEQQDLLMAAESLRDRAMLLILLHGLRLSELCSLTVGHYRRGRLVHVPGKGGRVRTVPLHPVACATLEQYLRTRAEGSRMFPLERRQVQKLVAYYGCKIGRQITPHALRHSFATSAVRSIGLTKAQLILGHQSPKTTMIYTHLDASDLQEAIEAWDRFGPRRVHASEGVHAGRDAAGQDRPGGGEGQVPPSAPAATG